MKYQKTSWITAGLLAVAALTHAGTDPNLGAAITASFEEKSPGDDIGTLPVVVSDDAPEMEDRWRYPNVIAKGDMSNLFGSLYATGSGIAMIDPNDVKNGATIDFLGDVSIDVAASAILNHAVRVGVQVPPSFNGGLLYVRLNGAWGSLHELHAGELAIPVARLAKTGVLVEGNVLEGVMLNGKGDKLQFTATKVGHRFTIEQTRFH